MTIEFPSNFKVLLDAWNMKTNAWLRGCAYKRVTLKGKKPEFRSRMITFWHSTASVYYGFIAAAARQTPRLSAPCSSCHPAPLPPRHFYGVLAALLFIAILNYFSSPYIILGGKESEDVD